MNQENQRKQNITLIGMPGVGKSTIGVLLAKATGFAFIDTDLLIQEQQKALLQQVVDTHGFSEFVEIEASVISSLSCCRSVIATGGSAIYGEQAMEHLKQIAVIVFLDLPLEKIKKRLSNIATRGVVLGENQTLDDLYKERLPLYEKYADFTIQCENKSMEQIVSEIIEKTLPLQR